MISAPKPHNERARLDALWAYELLDTEPELAFGVLTEVAASFCRVPIALVTLVDAERQWFKARYGLEGVPSTGRDVSFCAHAILQNGIFEVLDAREDPRFADNPLVTGGPRLRFYAGMPLIEPSGMALGTLCVVDREPRKLTQTQRMQLEDLAQSTLGLIKMRIRPSEMDGYRRTLMANESACYRLSAHTQQLRALGNRMLHAA